jgi:putative flippase GtrA
MEQISRMGKSWPFRILARQKFREIISFIWVGGLGTGLYIAMSTLAVQAGVVAWISSFLSYATLIPASYFLHRRITFRTLVPHRSAFPKFLAMHALGLFLSATLAYCFATGKGLVGVLEFGCIAAVIAVVNFSVLKLWAFASTEK